MTRRQVLASLAVPVLAAAQPRVSRQGAHRMEITLERLSEDQWEVIDPGLVLDTDDCVRFRYKANFTGYLYVTNRSTSDNTTLLFPRSDTGSNNRVIANREYFIPATQGAFRVGGPAGHDVISWVVSPVELGRPEPPRPSEPSSPPTLMPRCDDSIFRARGACVDTSAGPQANRSKEKGDGLVFIREKESSVIASTNPLKGPLVYDFHLAHR